jgi:hypothetical protein
MERLALAGLLLSLLALISASAATGQNNPYQKNDFQKMERFLDQVDRPGSWPQPKATTQPKRQLLTPSNRAAGNAVSPSPGGAAAQQAQPAFSPQNILRVLLGAPAKGTASGTFSGARGNVEENLATARDQASRAESACERASSGSDRDSRLSAAEEARYAAQAAREAADRASGQADNTTSDISDLAAQARAAADQAQAAADRATGNAEGGGW